jgi:hypothetical protein
MSRKYVPTAKLTRPEVDRLMKLAFKVGETRADMHAADYNGPDFKVIEAKRDLAVAELMRALLGDLEIES